MSEQIPPRAVKDYGHGYVHEPGGYGGDRTTEPDAIIPDPAGFADTAEPADTADAVSRGILEMREADEQQLPYGTRPTRDTGR